MGGNGHLENIAITRLSLLLESTEKAWEYWEKEFNSLSDQGNTGAPSIFGDLLHFSTGAHRRRNFGGDDAAFDHQLGKFFKSLSVWS